MTRQTAFLWMRDILDHLNQCHDQWQDAEPGTERYLADSIKRDLDEFRRLCDQLQNQPHAAPTLASWSN